MPRAKGGIGRTGKKHKKKSKFEVHRQIKGGDGTDISAAPSTANSPGQSAVEVDAGAGGALHTRRPSRCLLLLHVSCACCAGIVAEGPGGSRRGPGA